MIGWWLLFGFCWPISWRISPSIMVKSLSTSQYRNLLSNWKLTGAYRVLNHMMGFNHWKYRETTDNWSILVGWLLVFFLELDDIHLYTVSIFGEVIVHVLNPCSWPTTTVFASGLFCAQKLGGPDWVEPTVSTCKVTWHTTPRSGNLPVRASDGRSKRKSKR